MFIEITHEIYRWMFNYDNIHKELKLFISHTKNDERGLNFAKELKSFIDSDTTLNNFFDSNDIQKGEEFNNEILKNIKDSTLVIVHSNLYSSRYWCQKEIIYAKQNNRPIISVDILDGIEDRIFPMMCNFPNIRYNINVLSILELALIETIRFHYCDVLMKTYKECEYIPPHSITFNRVPDVIDINNYNNNEIITYPEPPVYEEECIIYNKKKIITPLSYNQANLKEKRIGISISDISEIELVKIGQDNNNLKYLSQTLAKKMLWSNATLIYGGDLREGGFTQFLFEEAMVLQDKTKSKDIHLENYIAWPIYLNDSNQMLEWKANYISVANMIECKPVSDIWDHIDKYDFLPPNNVYNKYCWARCLTDMRREMIESCDVRISAGGRLTEYKGCMPGVLEEIIIAVEQKKSIFY